MKQIPAGGVFVLVAALSSAAQQNPLPGTRAGAPPPGQIQPGAPPPRVGRAATPSTGTSRIRLRVVSETGTAVRGAEVSLSGDGLSRQGQTLIPATILRGTRSC